MGMHRKRQELTCIAVGRHHICAYFRMAVVLMFVGPCSCWICSWARRSPRSSTCEFAGPFPKSPGASGTLAIYLAINTMNGMSHLPKTKHVANPLPALRNLSMAIQISHFWKTSISSPVRFLSKWAIHLKLPIAIIHSTRRVSNIFPHVFHHWTH